MKPDVTAGETAQEIRVVMDGGEREELVRRWMETYYNEATCSLRMPDSNAYDIPYMSVYQAREMATEAIENGWLPYGCLG